MKKEEETHSACNRRLKKEGEKTQCCYCVPHEDCEWKKEVDDYNNFYK